MYIENSDRLTAAGLGFGEKGNCGSGLVMVKGKGIIAEMAGKG
jgi:hypothetical protein